MSEWIKQEPYVDDDGIYIPLHPYIQAGGMSPYQLVMTRDMFIEAYNKYIKNEGSEKQNE